MYPTASDLQRTDHRATLYAVAAYCAEDEGAASSPPANVHVIPAIVDKVLGGRCGGHPSVAQRAAAAAQIAPIIKSAMGW